jgi:hypothetical protein
MANLDNPVNPLGPGQGDQDTPGEIDKIDPSTRVLGNDLVVGRMYWVVRYANEFFSGRYEAFIPPENAGRIPARQWAEVKRYATVRRGNVNIVGDHTPFMGNSRHPWRTREISIDRTSAYYPAPDSPRMRGRDLTSLKRVGLAKNLPNDLEALTGQFLTGKKGTTDGQMDQLRQDTGEQLASRPSGRPRGGRTRRRRRTQRGGIPPPGGEPRLTIAIPRPQVPGPRAESGAQAPRPRGGRKTRRRHK